MAKPFVSIIIPCYNGAEYIRESIESALAQTYSSREIIVIDDGSTDGTLNVIRSFSETVRWETGPNRGGCAARNRGMELARGDFIQFLDADDLLSPDKLERQLPVAMQHRDDIVYCDFRTEIIGDVREPLVCSRSHVGDAVVLTLEIIIGTPTPLYPRECVSKVGGWWEGLACGQDYDLNLRLACSGVRFHHIPETLVTVRRRPDSVSSDTLRLLDEWERIYCRAYRLLQESDSLDEPRAEAFAAGFARHARSYIRLGHYRKAAERFQAAHELHPSGGLRKAYGPWGRQLLRLLGPIATEKFVLQKRRLVNGK